MSGLTICALCEHICQPPLRIEPVQCLAGISMVEKTDFVTGRTVITYDRELLLCSERNCTGHCALFAQRAPGKLTIIEAPQRRHWWQFGIAARPVRMRPDRQNLVTHINPDLLPPTLQDDDCGDYHRWPR